MRTFLLFLIGISTCITAQTSQPFPLYPGCEPANAEACFYEKLEEEVYRNYSVPADVTVAEPTTVIVLFEVTSEGKFRVQYVDAPKLTLADEARRVFDGLPTVSPPTYNGVPTYARYTIRLVFPKDAKPASIPVKQGAPSASQAATKAPEPDHPEFDAIVYQTFQNPQFRSHLNVPFSHTNYARFDDEMNRMGTNSHTASKPFTYAEVSKYFDFDAEAQQLKMNSGSWLERKLFDENTVQIQGDGYWFTLDPLFDLRVGRNTPGDVKYSYVNTRGIRVQGGIGETIDFTTSIFESQGRFADYYNAYAASLAPAGGNPAIIPGIGIAKSFKTDAFDFPVAEANLTLTPNRFINLQLGYGRNFIGDGYRSLLQGDAPSPYPFVKINTTFWKIKYTNTYMWMKDVRAEVTEDRTYETKYMANHYLSWNVTKRWNLGFFESVVWANTNGRGFDASFVNPIIFYRAVEFASSARSGNALLGLTSKYKVNNSINLYGQFLLDEFSLGDVREGQKSWKNKFGYQIGAKYFNAFGVDNLLLQAEYNHVRPYVYAHSDPLTNYAHNNQSLGHNWGGNFREVILVARYHYKRWFADAKMTVGVRGLDFNTAEDSFNYGGDIFRDYEIDRPYDTGVSVGQGNKTNVLILDMQAGWLLNPASNLKIFGSVLYRNFDPAQETASAFKDATTWFSLGIRSDIFNWYFDY